VRFGYFEMAFLGPESQTAAEAAECASDQGKFWEYHDMLFDNQLGENRGTFNTDKLKQFASQLNLSRTGFDACLDGGKYTAQVKNDTQVAANAGINSTPAFLLNGQKLSGAQPFEYYQKLIDAAKGK
jgi:protein-disulfide isomerase